jgi:MFS family permease
MRNITIAYTLSFLWKCWFWLGIWVFYYLRFTDYAGIGFLEAVMITTATIGEIPTGAIADILGKKIAVTLAFFLGAVGNILMAFAPNYWVLVASIMTMTIGGAFYSGSLEALVYDTLKQSKKIDLYQKVIGRMTTMQNLGMAFSGILGGFLYKWHVSLPFLLVATAYLIGLILSFWLKEPIIDTEKYSWTKFIHQNAEGFRQLFANRKLAIMVMAFLIPGAFMIATENVLNYATAVELGFSSIQLGIFATILYLFGVVVSEKTEWLSSRLNAKWIYGGSVAIYALTLLVIPKAAFLTGAILLLVRYGTQTFFGNYESVRINAVIDSRYRATTLSTFSLLRNIPYVLTATVIGMMMNFYTAKTFSMYFGVIFLSCLVGFYGVRMLLKEPNK